MSYVTDEMLEKAIEIAVKAHAGQKDKAGQPYILHVLRVMMQMDTIEEKIVAVLHDVVEDTKVSLEYLKEEGFPPEIVYYVSILTHGEDETREEYLEGICYALLTIKVKLADNSDNLDVLRLYELGKSDLKRINRYLGERRYLVAVREDFKKRSSEAYSKFDPKFLKMAQGPVYDTMIEYYKQVGNSSGERRLKDLAGSTFFEAIPDDEDTVLERNKILETIISENNKTLRKLYD